MSEVPEPSGSSPTISDRRFHLRQPVRSLAYVELGAGNGGIVLNISEGGLAVQAVASLVQDRLPNLRFQFSQEWVETSGRIAWKSESRKVAGIEFVALPTKTRDQIKAWIALDTLPSQGSQGERDAKQARTKDEIPVSRDLRAAAKNSPELAAKTSVAVRQAPDLPEPAKDRPNLRNVEALKEILVSGARETVPGENQVVLSLTASAEAPNRWKLAGMLGLFALLSLAAGWAAGRGVLVKFLENVTGVFSSRSAVSPDSGSTPNAEVANLSDIDVVDKDNQHWLIPYVPSGPGSPASPSSQIGRVSTPPTNLAPALKNEGTKDRASPPSELTQTQPGPALSAAPSPASADRNTSAQSPSQPEAKQPHQTGALQYGELINNVQPVYPKDAVERGIEGTVKLYAAVDVDGTIRTLEAESGPPLLVPAAMTAVRQWRYAPTLLNGHPIQTGEEITIVFRLPRSPK